MAVSGLERVGSQRVPVRPGPGPWRRARIAWAARLRAPQLDRELAAGHSAHPGHDAPGQSAPVGHGAPGQSAVLELRAARLTGQRSRRRLAAGLARVRCSLDDPTAGLTAAIRPDRREVVAARTAIATLERRLRAPRPVRARGMAMLQMLLTEDASPLYRPAEAGALGRSLLAAAAELEPRGAAG